MFTLLQSFLWVTLFEFTQNIIALSGVVNVVQEYKKKKPTTALILGIMAGALTYVSLKALENRKLLGTTLSLESGQTSFFVMLVGIATFTVGIFIGAKYFLWKKSTIKTDIILGLVFAVLLSLIESWSQISTSGWASITLGRGISHTLAFLVAFPATIVGLRKVIELPEGKTVTMLTLVTLMMTVIIVAVDYGPFLRR